jgi:hypothetical protein
MNQINTETKVKSTTVLLNKRMPVIGTVAEVVAAAKKVYPKYHSTRKATYGGGTQIEVRCTRDGYYGRDIKIVATYEIIE